jgi:hypothetical protein
MRGDILAHLRCRLSHEWRAQRPCRREPRALGIPAQKGRLQDPGGQVCYTFPQGWLLFLCSTKQQSIGHALAGLPQAPLLPPRDKPVLSPASLGRKNGRSIKAGRGAGIRFEADCTASQHLRAASPRLLPVSGGLDGCGVGLIVTRADALVHRGDQPQGVDRRNYGKIIDGPYVDGCGVSSADDSDSSGGRGGHVSGL